MQIMSPSGQLLGWFFGKALIAADGRSVRLLPMTEMEKLPTEIVAPAKLRVLDLPLAVVPFYRAERTELFPRPHGRQFTQRSYAIAERLPEDFWTLWDAVEFREDLFA